MNILCISGSLRAASINSTLLRAMARLAPADICVTLFRGVGELPLFNPDLETQVPARVAEFRAQVAASDALVIASPEYAHGIAGTIKNALDWLVSFEAFVYKPVAVLNASPRAYRADVALRETLRTMSAVVVEPASISVALLGDNLTEEGILAHPLFSRAIRSSLRALQGAVLPRAIQDPASKNVARSAPRLRSMRET